MVSRFHKKVPVVKRDAESKVLCHFSSYLFDARELIWSSGNENLVSSAALRYPRRRTILAPSRGARHDGQDVRQGPSVCSHSFAFTDDRRKSLEQDSGEWQRRCSGE